MSDDRNVVYDDWRRAARTVAALWVLGTIALALFVLGVTSEEITVGFVATTTATAAIVLGVPGLIVVGLIGLVDLRRNRSLRG